MINTVGILLTNPNNIDTLGIKNSLGKTNRSLLNLTGNNYGNLAFKYAASLFTDDELYPVSYCDDPIKVKKNIRALLIPEANLLNKDINYERAADFIKKIEVPCLLFGVGAQAFSKKESITIPKGTIDFLKEVASCSPIILTRGEWSSSVAKDNGIDNTAPCGCPSMLINSSNKLWNKIVINSRKIKSIKNMVITEGIYKKRKDLYFNKLEKRLFSFVIDNDADYVVQAHILAFSRNDEVDEESLYYLKEDLCPTITLEEFRVLSNTRFRAFTRIDAWIEYYRSRSFIIGTRIHGNILGIQAERPSFPICHDYRTIELCETMGIPYLLYKDILNLNTNHDLLNLINKAKDYDHEKLDFKRACMSKLYIENLNKLDINPSKHLMHLALHS